MEKLIFVYVVSAVFYVVIPLLMYVVQVSQWHFVRKRLFELKGVAELSYKDLRERKNGLFCVYGFIDAIEKDCIWITTGDLTVKVLVKDHPVFFIPEISNKFSQFLPATRSRFRTPFPLPDGTGVFVSGQIDYSTGEPVFKSQRDCRINILFYSGQKKNLLKDSVISCRLPISVPRFFHPAPLLLGSMLSFLLFYILRSEISFYFPFYTAGAAALFPLAIYIPPGVVLVFLGDRFIKRLRDLSIKKDLSTLFGEETKRSFASEKILFFTIIMIAAGLLSNSIIIYIVLLFLF
ncbi:MAG: hypothetical protein JXR63_04155 [Spirochaetales bacterium]|nr:hypothetical protein [Spirochaetales bacterium]